MKRFFTLTIIMLATIWNLSASEPLRGTICTPNGRPVKGVKIHFNDTLKPIKTDVKGEFLIDNATEGDVFFVEYKGRTFDVVVNDQPIMNLIVGEDGRIFEKNDYSGESFHGTLMDYKGKGIRGAMVYASAPFDYVKSDRQGRFVLDNINPTDTIHVRHDGYIHDIAMDGSKGMYIIIGRNNGRRENDEEINTGIGTMRMRDYNGPYSMMTAIQLEATNEMLLTDAIRWMPGIVVNKKGSIRIGLNGKDPMWIIDGFPGSPMDVTVSDVRSVVVLKNGMEYGSRGAGGVIIVTTKWSSL